MALLKGYSHITSKVRENREMTATVKLSTLISMADLNIATYSFSATLEVRRWECPFKALSSMAPIDLQ